MSLCRIEQVVLRKKSKKGYNRLLPKYKEDTVDGL